MEVPEAGEIVATSDVHVTLLQDTLYVGSVPAGELQAAAYPLLKAIIAVPRDTAGLFSFTQEEDGLTLVMDDRCRAAFDELGEASPVTYAPHKWRAFEIHLGTLAWEVPGVVAFLSTSLAESAVSLLNITSSDRDYLLVAEADVAAAAEAIRERLQHDVDGLREAVLEVRRSHSEARSPSVRASGTNLAEELSAAVAAEAAAAAEASAEAPYGRAAAPSGTRAAGLTPRTSGDGDGGALGATLERTMSSTCKLSDAAGESGGELYVKVLAARLLVVRLQLALLPQSTHAIITRLLFSRRSARSFWSYTHTDAEISLIVEEEVLPTFPPDAIVGASTVWRAVKLCGRSFAFDETGVVSAMYAPHEAGVHLLNISTFATNFSLVEETDLERALAAFEVPHRLEEPWDDDEPDDQV